MSSYWAPPYAVNYIKQVRLQDTICSLKCLIAPKVMTYADMQKVCNQSWIGLISQLSIQSQVKFAFA